MQILLPFELPNGLGPDEVIGLFDNLGSENYRSYLEFVLVIIKGPRELDRLLLFAS